MALTSGMSCVKYLLFCFNLLFAITGLIILIAGVRAQMKAHPYINLTDEHFYQSAPVVLIVIGIIVFIVAFFGCCGAVRENHCMIVTFSVLLLGIFVAEVAVGVTGYMKRGDLEASIKNHLQINIKEYDNNPDIANTFDILQTDLQCCGIDGPADWNVTRPEGIPDSCCSQREITADNTVARCSPASEHFHKDGCLAKLVEFMRSIATVLGGVGIGIAVVQLLGVIFACCLARSIRSQYETV